MSKRVLIVCQHFWPESFRINDIAEYLLEQGVEVDVLCGRPNYPSGKLADGYTLWNRRKEHYKGATIYRSFEIPRGNNSNIRIFLNYISFPLSSIFHVPRLLFKKYDSIFIYQLSPVMMSIAGIILGKLKRTETTMYVLDLWPENLYSVLPIKNSLLRRAASAVSHWHYRHVDKLIALSERMKERLVATTNIPADKIIVLPQAAEKLYEQELHDAGLKRRFSKGFNLVFTGSITPAQSFDTIIQAAKMLRDSGIHDINWIIVGDGMARQQVEADVKAADLDDVFFFEGQKPVADMPKYTAIADGLVGCLVKSDLLEATIPAKVMSYIASAKPLLLAMDGEVQQLINTTIRGGFAGPTEDYRALAANIKKLYRLSPAKRKEMQQRLRDYHNKHFERNLLLEKLSTFMLS